jgi:hypothetical protein
MYRPGILARAQNAQVRYPIGAEEHLEQAAIVCDWHSSEQVAAAPLPETPGSRSDSSLASRTTPRDMDDFRYAALPRNRLRLGQWISIVEPDVDDLNSQHLPGFPFRTF